MEVTPTGQRVLIKVQREDVTKSGIVLTNVQESNTITAEVLGVGPDVTTVAADDIVILAAYAGDEVEVLGEDHKIVHEESIIAKVNG